MPVTTAFGRIIVAALSASAVQFSGVDAGTALQVKAKVRDLYSGYCGRSGCSTAITFTNLAITTQWEKRCVDPSGTKTGAVRCCFDVGGVIMSETAGSGDISAATPETPRGLSAAVLACVLLAAHLLVSNRCARPQGYRPSPSHQSRLHHPQASTSTLLLPIWLALSPRSCLPHLNSIHSSPRSAPQFTSSPFFTSPRSSHYIATHSLHLAPLRSFLARATATLSSKLRGCSRTGTPAFSSGRLLLLLVRT